MAYKQSCPWVVVLEDDAIISNRFFERVSNIIAKYSNGKQLSFIKLFFPEYLNGWENSLTDCALLLSLAVFSSCVLASISLFLKARFPYRRPQFRCAQRHHSSARLMLQFSLSYLPWMIATYWMVGKQSVITPYAPGESPAPSPIYTVGQLYPRHFMAAAAAHLRQDDSNLPVDLALSDLADEAGLRSYITVPSLVQHVGLFSSNLRRGQGGRLRQSLSFPDSSDDLP